MTRERKFTLAAIAIIVLALTLPWFVHFMAAPGAEEAPEGASNWVAYRALLTNVPHYMLELTIEAITGSLAFLWGVAWVRRHDKTHHDCCTPEEAAAWLTPERQATIDRLIEREERGT